MDKIFTTEPYRVATYCLRQYAIEKGWEHLDDMVIDAQDIYDTVIYPEYEINLSTNKDLGYADDGKILGMTIATENLILIDRSIAPGTNDSRYSFTLAHEIGHALLHNESDQHLSFTTEQSIYNEYYLNESNADCFAERLLVPHELLVLRFKQCYGACDEFFYTGPGTYRINQVEACIESLSDFYLKLTEALSCYFPGIPADFLVLMLKRWRFIEDKTIKPRDVQKMQNFLINGSVLYKFAESCGGK